MILPTAEELDEVAELIGGKGCRYAALNPPQRVIVVDLCIKAGIRFELDAIQVELVKVGDWAKNSKLLGYHE